MTTWRDQLAFAPLESAERGEEVGRRLRHAIELGILEDGTQLPNESELAAKMGVSKLTLRAGLTELREAGLIETRRGKTGGSFVKAGTGEIARVQRQSLAAYSLEELRDIRDYHAFLAGTAAAEAARRAHRLPMARLMYTSTEVRSCKHPADAIRADSQFHIELASSSGSVRLTRQEMALQAEVGPLIWADPLARREAAAADHIRIVEAIKAGDAERARAEAEGHIRRDMDLVIDERMALDRPAVASPTEGGSTQDAVAAIESFAALLHRTAVASMRLVEEKVRGSIASGHSREEIDAEVYESARTTLAGAIPLLYGTGFLADPSYFGEGWIAWCYAPTGPQTLERLYMDMQFYDFPTAPWKPDERADDNAIHTSYAYVDGSGTNENIITLTKRVTVDGKYVGAVGADLLIRQLQTAFEPLLRQLPPNTFMADQTGAIIATNTGRFVGGTVPETDHRWQEVDLPELPWRLFIGTSSD